MFRIQRINSLIADVEEQIFDMMSDCREGIKFHHGRGAFDGMHDSENFIHIIRGEIPFFFVLYQHFIQLIQQRIGFIQIGIKNIIHAVIHCVPTTFVKNYSCKS